MADHFETSTVISCGTHLKVFLWGGGGELHTVTAHDRFLLNFFFDENKIQVKWIQSSFIP